MESEVETLLMPNNHIGNDTEPVLTCQYRREMFASDTYNLTYNYLPISFSVFQVYSSQRDMSHNRLSVFLVSPIKAACSSI
jgi:hypothetical protein